MKLVLASQGFTTPEIVRKTVKLVGKSSDEINVAIVNEAYTGISPGHDYRWMIDELSLIGDSFGGTIGLVSLRAHSFDELRERFAFADIIYIVGGKQLVLPKLFKATGFEVLLRELAQEKVIFGTSAGANVLGKQITDTAYWDDQYGSHREFLDNPSLGFVNFNILPHYDRNDHPRRNKEILNPILNKHPFPLYGVTDEQAVFYDDGDISFAGGEPVIFGG